MRLFPLNSLNYILFLLFFFNITSAEEGYLSSQFRVQELFVKFQKSVVRVKASREDVIDGKTKRFLKMGSGFL